MSTRYAAELERELDAYAAFWSVAHEGKDPLPTSKSTKLQNAWIVVENTPGYLPEDDDPAIFDSLDAAVSYAKERAIEVALDLYGDDAPDIVCQTSETSWFICSTTPRDLGRVIEVLPC